MGDNKPKDNITEEDMLTIRATFLCLCFVGSSIVTGGDDGFVNFLYTCAFLTQCVDLHLA